jgi:hypothetical protein
MTPTSQAPQGASEAPDLAAMWIRVRRLHPIYAELAREFAIDAPAISAEQLAVQSPEQKTVEEAQRWLQEMDDRIQVHQVRQFMQTTSLMNRDAMVALIQHLLAGPRSASSRDKIDFLLVQHFSQRAPTDLEDERADIAYVAEALEPILGKVELKIPVWLNALDRTLDSARRCKSLDELLHGGVLDQGRKAKAQAGDLFYLPIALVGFTRYGYLMRRAFFRLMLTDLNSILDGLTELDEKGVETIDCRRAQFSQQEPILRLRMICQSWKVMFQAEYSSGQPLRMLVDLRASVDSALGRNSEESGEQALEATAAAKAKLAMAAAAGAETSSVSRNSKPSSSGFAVTNEDAPEFEVSSATPEWNADADASDASKK